MLLVQVVDRIAMLVGFPAGVVLVILSGSMHGDGARSLGLSINFLLTGTCIGLLAYRYLWVKCSMPVKSRLLISLTAAVLTNPCWVTLSGLGA